MSFDIEVILDEQFVEQIEALMRAEDQAFADRIIQNHALNIEARPVFRPTLVRMALGFYRSGNPRTLDWKAPTASLPWALVHLHKGNAAYRQRLQRCK